MLLSALALAAALQATPDIALKGYPLGERAKPAGELTIAPRKVKSVLLHQAPERSRFIAPPRRTFKLGPPRPLPKKDFVVNPQTVNCRSTAPELVSSSETLQAVPLSKMPKARGERAVARMVDGCPVPVLIAQEPIGR